MLVVSAQHIALTLGALASLDTRPCGATSALLQPAVIGAIAGGLVSVLGAVGVLVDRLRRV